MMYVHYTIPALSAEKAPAGYGLGAPSRDITDNNWDNATENGWYRGKINGVWCCGLVSTYGNPTPMLIHQRVYQVSFAEDGRYMVSMERKGYDITESGNYTWTEWEYINPPMVLGVEYRTTKRHNGKVVFAKAMSFGTFPNSTRKIVNFILEPIDDVVSENWSIYSGDWRRSLEFINAKSSIYTSASDYVTSVVVDTTADSSVYSGIVTLEYTKP